MRRNRKARQAKQKGVQSLQEELNLAITDLEKENERLEREKEHVNTLKKSSEKVMDEGGRVKLVNVDRDQRLMTVKVSIEDLGGPVSEFLKLDSLEERITTWDEDKETFHVRLTYELEIIEEIEDDGIGGLVTGGR